MEVSPHIPVCFDDVLRNYAEGQRHRIVQDIGDSHKETEIKS
jgi:hypothetical protein